MIQTVKLQDRNSLIPSKMPSNKAQTLSSRFPAVLLCYTTASLLTSGSPGPTEADGAWWLLSPGEIQGVLPNWFSWKVLIELSSMVEDGLVPVWKAFTYLAPVCNLCGKLSQFLDPGMVLCMSPLRDVNTVATLSLYSPAPLSRVHFWPKQVVVQVYFLSFPPDFLVFINVEKWENKGEYCAADWWRESLSTNRSVFGERRGVEEEEEGDSD